MIHLVCNAHIDSAWLWEWEEGIAAALSTFRAAADFCEEYEKLVFNHNEALLYEYIEQFDPPLFSRIKKLVKDGKWKIMGGWYLQPDCNMPSGESILRQIECGQNWFSEKFGITFGGESSYNKESITTAINFDPFGHSHGLVQLLAKSGYKNYLICRPNSGSPGHQIPDLFEWEGLDNSKIMVLRSPYMYNSVLGDVESKINKFLEQEKENRDPGLLLWGVGNHGGGPSRKDIEQIEILSKNISLKHSTPEKFFLELESTLSESQLKERKIEPVLKTGLNPWGVGCYTSQIRVKQKHRELEQLLFSTEKLAVQVSANNLADYPFEDLAQAERDLLKMEFHDILPGSGIQEVEEYGLQLAGHAVENLQRIRFKMLCKLLMQEGPVPAMSYPVYVYNPHPYCITDTFSTELQLAEQNYGKIWSYIRLTQNEKNVPCQIEKEASNIPIDWRKKISFYATLEPGLNRFIGYAEEYRKPDLNYVPGENEYIFNTEKMGIKISRKTGCITSYVIDNQELIGNEGIVPIVLADSEDPWSMNETAYGKIRGNFTLMSEIESAQFRGIPVEQKVQSVNIIECGSVRTVVEALLKFGESKMVINYLIPVQGDGMEISIRVFWHEVRSMLKLCIPIGLNKDSFNCISSIMAGRETVKSEKIERVGQKWIAFHDSQVGLAVINNGTYGYDYNNSNIGISLLRSPSYSAHPIENRAPIRTDRWNPRIDQGERAFLFKLVGKQTGTLLTSVDEDAQAWSEKPYVLSVFPLGEKTNMIPAALELKGKGIIIHSVRETTIGKILIRLQECTGSKRNVQLRCLNATIDIELDSHEMALYIYDKETEEIKKEKLLVTA